MKDALWPRHGVARRDFLKTAAAGGAAVALNGLLPSSLVASSLSVPSTGRVVDTTRMIEDPAVRALALRAIDAAKAAGASYADVRLTRILTQGKNTGFATNERFGVGVRAFVDGYVGFVASPYWGADEVVRLARDAVAQAKTNAKGAPPQAAWTPIPAASGHWATPVKVDPFVVPAEQKIDLLESWIVRAAAFRGCSSGANASFTREERAVATTDGAFFTQTLYQSGGAFELSRLFMDVGPDRGSFSSVSATGLTSTAAGWEIFDEAKVPEQLPGLFDAALASLHGPPVKAGDIGRYDVVFDGTTMAALTNATIGVAAQVDRALGLEANASGTSYLGPDPLALLGSYQAASSLVNITANRSMPRGLGTVKWDDEGVVPDDFSLVKDGVLVDYQTTREQAMWLAPWYQKQGKPIHSRGCAGAQDALSITMQHAPNLVLQPGAQDIDFDDLVADTKKGLAVMGGDVETDFQARTGSGTGHIREIVDGKLGPVVGGLAYLFSATQLWKNVTVLGGAHSLIQIPNGDSKGQPVQGTSHSVQAVPAKITNVDFIDPRRKA